MRECMQRGCVCARMHACVHACMRACMHACMRRGCMRRGCMRRRCMRRWCMRQERGGIGGNTRCGSTVLCSSARSSARLCLMTASSCSSARIVARSTSALGAARSISPATPWPPERHAMLADTFYRMVHAHIASMHHAWSMEHAEKHVSMPTAGFQRMQARTTGARRADAKHADETRTQNDQTGWQEAKRASEGGDGPF